MKKLIRYSAAALTLLAPLSVYAHGGHLAEQGWHGLLHVEHIMMLVGVARPSAQGQAIMSTDTAATSACARRGSGPHKAHAANAITAIAITAGTK